MPATSTRLVAIITLAPVLSLQTSVFLQKRLVRPQQVWSQLSHKHPCGRSNSPCLDAQTMSRGAPWCWCGALLSGDIGGVTVDDCGPLLASAAGCWSPLAGCRVTCYSTLSWPPVALRTTGTGHLHSTHLATSFLEVNHSSYQQLNTVSHLYFTFLYVLCIIQNRSMKSWNK